MLTSKSCEVPAGRWLCRASSMRQNAPARTVDGSRSRPRPRMRRTESSSTEYADALHGEAPYEAGRCGKQGRFYQPGGEHPFCGRPADSNASSQRLPRPLDSGPYGGRVLSRVGVADHTASLKSVRSHRSRRSCHGRGRGRALKVRGAQAIAQLDQEQAGRCLHDGLADTADGDERENRPRPVRVRNLRFQQVGEE
jgi:hypothetical protein